jgi:hypothetical protein
MLAHIHNLFIHSLHVPAQTIEPLVSTLTERLRGAIGEHDEALAAAPIRSYTKPPAPYEVVWRGAVPEEYGWILASMVSTMVPDTTDSMIYCYHAI